MKEEFKKLVPIWGISKKEVEKISLRFNSEEELKSALVNSDIDFLSERDEIRLIEFYANKEAFAKGKCNGCGNKLPKVLDRGICPLCSVRN